MNDARDLVIEALALDEAAIIDVAVSYREAYRAAVHRLHEQHIEIQKLHASHHRLIEEFRSYRATTICGPRKVA
jgi:hypothetical protein